MTNIEKIKTVMLLGGRGERLRPLTDSLPKPMIQIESKPLLYHIFQNSRKQGFKQFIFKTGYLSNKIFNYFEYGKKFNCKIDYFAEKTPLGTCGGLNFLKKEKKPLIIIYGDVLVNINLRKLLFFHINNGAQATLVSHASSHPEDSDILVTEGNRVTNIIHKPGNRRYGNLTSAGVYILNSECFSFITEGKFDFTHDLFPLLLKDMKVYAYKTDEYMKDVGTIERLKEVKEDIQKGNVFDIIDAVFLDRDGTINEEVNLLHKREMLKLLPNAAEGIKKLNKINMPVVVATNQPVVARGMCTEKDVQKINESMIEMLKQEGAFIDKVYYCPHHPETHHNEGNMQYRIKCRCRKPEIGMLLDAKKDFNLNLSKCFMVGDSTRDILTGKNAGCKTILVKTGYRGEDKKHDVKPDYVAECLLDAADIILRFNKTKPL